MDPHLLNTIRTRPRFVHTSSMKKEEYMNLLRDYFQKKHKTIGGYISDDLSYFRIKNVKENFWSPCLQLKVEEDPYDNVTYVRGVFGPKPAVWTLFSFAYFGILVLAVLSLLFYFTSLSFNPMPVLLYIGVFLLLIVFSLFMASKLGQIKTRNQMRLLKTFILMVIKDELSIQSKKS